MYTVAVLNWDLSIYTTEMTHLKIYSMFVGCLFTYCKNLDLSLAWQLYNSLSVLPKYLAKGRNILLSSYYSNVVLVVCTYELTVLSYKQWVFLTNHTTWCMRLSQKSHPFTFHCVYSWHYLRNPYSQFVTRNP
jgi:hypothetical protein